MALIVGGVPKQLRGVSQQLSISHLAPQSSHLTSQSHTSDPYLTPHILHLAPQASKSLTSNPRFHTSHIKTYTPHLTPHTFRAIPQTSYLKRKTGKLARIEWHGDDAT